MAEYSAIAEQTIAPGETVVFTETRVPCLRGFVRHRDGSGNFLLNGGAAVRGGCPYCRQNNVRYTTSFQANIAVPEGETVVPISVAFSVDGATDPASTMISTPAAADDFNSVSCTMEVPIWAGCCESFAVRNTSSIPITMSNALLNIIPPRTIR